MRQGGVAGQCQQRHGKEVDDVFHGLSPMIDEQRLAPATRKVKDSARVDALQRPELQGRHQSVQLVLVQCRILQVPTRHSAKRRDLASDESFDGGNDSFRLRSARRQEECDVAAPVSNGLQAGSRGR